MSANNNIVNSFHTGWLQVWLVQPIADLQNMEANLSTMEEMLADYLAEAKQPDLILLPDFFSVFEVWQIKIFAQVAGLHHYKWMRQMAERTGAVVATCLPVMVGTQVVQRFLWVPPQGPERHTDRAWPTNQFLSENQSDYTKPDATIFEVKGYKFMYIFDENTTYGSDSALGTSEPNLNCNAWIVQTPSPKGEQCYIDQILDNMFTHKRTCIVQPSWQLPADNDTQNQDNNSDDDYQDEPCQNVINSMRLFKASIKNIHISDS